MVPPLVRRSLAKAASWGAITPRRDNGRTRHSPTAHKRGSGGCSRVYFPACPLPLSPNRGLSGRDADWYFSLSSQFPIGLDYSTGGGVCQAGNLQPACRKSLFDTLPNFLKLQKSFKKLFDPTRKGTLTVPFHTILPSESFGWRVYRQPAPRPGKIRGGALIASLHFWKMFRSSAVMGSSKGLMRLFTVSRAASGSSW